REYISAGAGQACGIPPARQADGDQNQRGDGAAQVMFLPGIGCNIRHGSGPLYPFECALDIRIPGGEQGQDDDGKGQRTAEENTEWMARGLTYQPALHETLFGDRSQDKAQDNGRGLETVAVQHPANNSKY